jgi:hypothetical protein
MWEEEFGRCIWTVKNFWKELYLKRLYCAVLKIRYLWVTTVENPLFCAEADSGTAY